MNILKLLSLGLCLILTFSAPTVSGQSRPNQCRFDMSNSTISAQCYVMSQGEKIHGSGQARFTAAGLSSAKAQACALCRADLAKKVSPETGQATLSSFKDAQAKPEQKEVIIDEAQKLARQMFSQCLNNKHVMEQHPDTNERAKECFNFASKRAQKEVEQHRKENCQRESQSSEIVTCKDGSRYKLLDVNNLGGQVVDISRHISESLKKKDLGEQEDDSTHSRGQTR